MKMTRFALLTTICAVGLAGCPAEAPTTAHSVTMLDLDRDPPHHVLFRPGEVEWQDGPASLEQGAQFAVLEGDPRRDGVFTMQLKLPDGFVIQPHTHPNVERVTVLQGVFHLGMGSMVNPESATPLPAGSYTAMPRGMIHHAIAEGETIVQLTSVGPWVINYVDPDYRPRPEN